MLALPGIKSKSTLFAAVFAVALLLAGCDEYVHITRDPDLHPARHATWAWQTASRANGRGSRRVISRDEIGRARTETAMRDNDPENEILREKVRHAVEESMLAKGLRQVDDPDGADLVVDFHLAMRRRNVTVAYPGAYPGFVCGPYGCWDGWGWGPVGYENIHFREGTIVLDVLQEPSNHLAYRAVGEKPVKRDLLSFSQNEVNDIIRHMLKDLKPR